MRRYILSIISALFTICAAAQFPAKEAPFIEGEQLTYNVSYKAALVPNSTVAEVTMKVDSSQVDGVRAHHVWANARVLSFFRWFFDLNDTYEVWLDSSTLMPLRFANDLKEGRYMYQSAYRYDWNSMKVTTTAHRDKWAEDRVVEMDLTAESMDPLSAFFNLRAENAKGFKVGEQRPLHLVFGNQIRHVTFRLMGREKRNIKKVGTFNTLKFACQLASDDGESFEDGAEFYIWITDDRNMVPLYLESPIKVGSIRATISEMHGLKYPMDSKIK